MGVEENRGIIAESIDSLLNPLNLTSNHIPLLRPIFHDQCIVSGLWYWSDTTFPLDNIKDILA